MDKQHIIDEIRRTTTANDGEPLGWRRFLNETGIRVADWQGKYWARWSDAVVEAGFTPQKFQHTNDRSDALCKLAELTRKQGTFPTRWELDLVRRADSDFPNASSLLRPGGKAGLMEELSQYCQSHEGYEDVEAILRTTPIPASPQELPEVADSKLQYGYVYLILSARKYKIGFSKAALNRASVVSNLSPEGGEIIHLIRTDDPRGIEAYWHNRFADKRGNGEWFALSAADVKAFKRWKVIV